MAQTGSTGATGGHRAEGEIDWIAAERSPEFQDLVRKRRRFVIPATIFFLGWYTAFVLLAGYAPAFMGSSIYQGFTVGYALALTQFVMVWVLGGLYLRRADRDFDPLARRAAAKALESGAGGATTGSTTPAAGGHGDGGHTPQASPEAGAEPSSGPPAGPTSGPPAGGTTAPTESGGPAEPGAGDGGQAPGGLRSSPTPGAAHSRPPGGERS